MSAKPSPAAKFKARTRRSKSGCWRWTGAVLNSGYGKFWERGRHLLAHRFAYQQANGKLPAGKLVLHRCDNKLCVRPDHLFLGTYQDNSDDMVRKGRHLKNHVRGEDSPKAILNESQVRRIKALCGKLPQRTIARRFGVTQTSVSRIHTGANWAHV